MNMTRRGFSSRMSNLGFTIVELVVVITVLAVLTTLAVFGAAAMQERSQNAEAESKVATLRSALEKYHSENNEYPSAITLAGGGNGRALTNMQYDSIAATLKVSADVLRKGTYKFVPCAVSGALCCTMNASNECVIPATDGTSKYIMYFTRTATQATNGTALTFRTPISNCTYTFPLSDTTADNGYSAYYLMYRDYTDSNTATSWHVYRSDKGKNTRGSGCNITTSA